MARTKILILLTISALLMVIFQSSSPVNANPTPLVCGKHASIVNLYFPDENCYPNCARPHGGTCRKVFYGGRFCDCHDGYIFLKGVTGDCVRPTHCPKTEMVVANSTVLDN